MVSSPVGPRVSRFLHIRPGPTSNSTNLLYVQRHGEITTAKREGEKRGGLGPLTGCLREMGHSGPAL